MTLSRNFGEEQERWVYTRPTKHAPWDTGVRKDTLPRELDEGGNIMPGWTTMDGLELYTWSTSTEGYGGYDIYVRTRETINVAFMDSARLNLGSPVNTTYGEAMASISSDGLELYFSDYGRPRPGGHGGEDLWVTRRRTRDASWQEPENLGPLVNSTSGDSRVHISPDGLFLFFDSSRLGGYGESDLYVTGRKSLSDPWGQAVNLGPRVNSPTDEFNPNISADGRELFFVRNGDVWRIPIVTVEGSSDPGNSAPAREELEQVDLTEEVVPWDKQ